MSVKLCEICGERSAKYICQECGRSICEQCIEPYTWLCKECYEKIKRPSEEIGAEEKPLLHFPFIKLFILGFILMFVGMMTLILAALLTGLKDSLGFIFLIGPIPIILGSGQYASILIIIGAALTLICLIIFILLNRRGISLMPK